MHHRVPGMIALALLAATPVAAEKLELDHRLYPPLHAAMENPRDGTLYYDGSHAGGMLDRILVSGTSAERDWNEALELIVVSRKGKPASPQAWFEAFRSASESPCPGKVEQMSADEASLTFALEAPACGSAPALSGLYRVVYGRKTIYLVSAKLRGTMAPSQREQWLAVLNSAKLSG